MKKAALFATILALALGVSAQTLSFGTLPPTFSPTVLPNGYDNLDWSAFSYVAPSWSGAGAGFQQGPSTLNVAFMGGQLCELAEALCSASISPHSGGASPQESFQAQSAIVAAGYHAESVSVTAYYHGQFIGSQAYNLTTALQEIDFPVSWGAITQLVMETTKGTVVLYALNVTMAQQQAAGSTALNNGVLPNVPKRILDPPMNDASSGNGGPSGPPVQNAGPTVSIPVLDPPSQLTPDGSVSPPILYSGPNANGGAKCIPRSDAGGLLCE